MLVPLADLASEGPTGKLHHVSYQVGGPDGKANGILSFSYILNESPVRVSDSDPVPVLPVQDSIMLHHGSSSPTSLNDEETQEVCPPLENPASKPQLYPTLDTFENSNAKSFVYPSPLSDSNLHVCPPPPISEVKRSLYPVVSIEPVIAYPVPDSGVSGYHQFPTSLASYPPVEPVVGLAPYALPGYYPQPQASRYCYQTRGWDGRYS